MPLKQKNFKFSFLAGNFEKFDFYLTISFIYFKMIVVIYAI